MTFNVSEQDFWAMAELEEELACDVEAGFDLGRSTAAYVVSAKSYLDEDGLLTLLQDGLGDLLTADDIAAIATKLQNCTEDLVLEKLQPAKSA